MSLLCVYHKVRYQKANVLCQNFLDYLIKKFLPSCAMVFFQKWYIIESRYPANISTLFQRCLLVGTTSWRGATSNQRGNNVTYFNVGIYNVEQRWINVVYFYVHMNNVGKCRNNVMKMIISKKNKANHFKKNTRNSKF